MMVYNQALCVGHSTISHYRAIVGKAVVVGMECVRQKNKMYVCMKIVIQFIATLPLTRIQIV